MKEKTKNVKEEKHNDHTLKKLIKGLTYHYSEAVRKKKDGREITEYHPKERPLREDDVLSHRDYGNYVRIITKDGRRYEIKK